jgi:MFS transporter, DHA1 family, multidrug resistance protein
VPDPKAVLRTLLPAEQWRRNQIAVTVAAAMVFFGFTLFMPFLPFYVQSLGVIGIRPVAIWSGVFLTVSPLLASILGPFWARLGDRVGMKIMVERVLFAITLHWGLMFFARSVWQVLALRILLGLFSGFGTMSVALVTHGCPRDRIGPSVGALQSTQILSTAFGPFCGGILAQTLGIRSTFVVTFLLCACAFLFVLALYRNTAHEPDPPGSPELLVLPQEGPVAAGVRGVVLGRGTAARLTFQTVLGLPLFLPLLPMLFLVNLVDRALFLSVPLFLASLMPPGGAVEGTTGVVVSASALASAASAYLLGRRAGKTAPIRLLQWSLLGGAATILPLSLCRTPLWFGLVRAAVGMLIGGAATLAYTIGGAVIPGPIRAQAYAILSSAAMLGGSLGPILCGGLTSIDLRIPFFFGGAVYVGLALQIAYLQRRGAWKALGWTPLRAENGC